MQVKEVQVNVCFMDLIVYEYKVMEYLMLYFKKVIFKIELIEYIYDQDFDLDSNVIEVFVGCLCKKFDLNNILKFIEILCGCGYWFSQLFIGE